jgi:RAB protein geranylgeranyltransferase component A
MAIMVSHGVVVNEVDIPEAVLEVAMAFHNDIVMVGDSSRVFGETGHAIMVTELSYRNNRLANSGDDISFDGCLGQNRW